MDKYIGFDIDSKKTVACVVQKGERDRLRTLPENLAAMMADLMISKTAYPYLSKVRRIS
jgi:hypothetical protein